MLVISYCSSSSYLGAKVFSHKSLFGLKLPTTNKLIQRKENYIGIEKPKLSCSWLKIMPLRVIRWS